ncbi:MarR family winged helix-turn-helix transcriptional regulator [Paenibacillus humicola]|uniref:MarR family winged helix-turn-helix transcriptional regulator n=1 Tax=Paenibacillus humicola TaxID=3110540 RepID=UPI00237AD3B3|nr:MarR family transcriptional regulator [Paenibacillus humicola]
MSKNAEKIAGLFVRLLPLVYNRLNKPFAKGNPIPKPSSLTHLQLHILEELFHAGEGISMTHLAQQISISKQQLTPLISKLEETGFVVKAQDPHDRRAVRLFLADKGKETVTKHWAEFHRLFAERIAALGEDDLLDLDYAITKIIRIFEKMEV